ncbi:hypothetical protein C8T65DRAFT_642684 [Cerioporus squamosus]|nr:hypothetical protein C8T65DRAFT_642684 [Cerioporus squamosus]
MPKSIPGGEDTAFHMDVTIMEEAFATNAVGPAYVTQAFIRLVETSTKKTIVNISSTLSSMGARTLRCRRRRTRSRRLR